MAKEQALERSFAVKNSFSSTLNVQPRRAYAEGMETFRGFKKSRDFGGVKHGVFLWHGNLLQCVTLFRRGIIIRCGILLRLGPHQAEFLQLQLTHIRD